MSSPIYRACAEEEPTNENRLDRSITTGLCAAQQITDSNVARLRPVWSYHVNSLQRVETTPIVDGGIMYISEPASNVTAIDLRTGRPIWQYRRVLGDGSAFAAER